MIFPNIKKIALEKKVEIVQQYLTTEKTLRAVAKQHGISHKLLLYWVNLYKNGGAARFLDSKIHKRKLEKKIEEKIRLLKENNPGLSIRQAQDILKSKNIVISVRAIWRIWDTYGLILRGGDDPFGIFAKKTPYLDQVITAVKHFVKKQDYKHAAQIVNVLPRFSYNPLLKEIPEQYLNLRRRLERLWLIRGEIPWPQLLKKVRTVRKKFEAMGFHRTSLPASYLELVALEVIKDPVKKMSALRQFDEKIRGIRTRSIRFLRNRQEAAIYAARVEITKALKIIRKCRKLAHSLDAAYYWEATGNLFTNVGDYKQAFRCFQKGSRVANTPGAVEVFAQRMAHYGHTMAGRYRQGRKLLASARNLKNTGLFSSLYNFNRADLLYGQGYLNEAKKKMLEALERSTRVTRLNFIFAASIGMAGLAMALNNKKEAQLYLKKYLPLMKKYKLGYEERVLKCMLDLPVSWSDELLKMHSLKMLYLILCAARSLKIGDYRRAFSFADRHDLLGIFHRRIVFFPKIIQRLMEKGKKTGLPKAILSFPVFNQNISVYHIKFLGRLSVMKNGEHIRTRLTPKESAFLIHLALRVPGPHRFIPVEDLYMNFWHKSEYPSSLLSHLLVALKKKIKIAPHLLEITSSAYGSRLVNRGIFFTTDHGEFNTLLVEVRTLLKANEWQFALQEYKRLFTLMRGSFFDRMYDTWSDDMRRIILNQLENETARFVENCVKYGARIDARKIVKRLSSILPDSNLDITEFD